MQHIDNLASLHVYNDSSIAEPFTPSPVVDSRYTNGLRGAESGDMAFQLPQNGVVADRHAKTLHQTLSWQAADATTKKVNEFSDTLGSACVTWSNFG